MKTKIILTGTGAGELPYIGINGEICDRHHCSAVFIVEIDNEEYYFHIDFTPLAADGLLKAGIPLSKINTLLFSHGHEDHFDPYRLFAAKLNIGNVRLGFDPKFSRTVMKIIGPVPVVGASQKMLSRKECFPSDLRESHEETYCNYKKSKKHKKEILFFRGIHIDRNDIVEIAHGITVKCIEVAHPSDSVISIRAKSPTAFGFLISVKEGGNKPFTSLYLTDFLHFRPEDKFKRNISGYGIDLCILGMPIPFPGRGENNRHIGLEPTLKFFKSLKDEDLIKKKAPIVFTHLSDRWQEKGLLERADQVIKKYWNGGLVWIPEKDGFEIIYSKGRLRKKGKTI
jgi:ribonuclease BN (tRNA processing enzyme)